MSVCSLKKTNTNFFVLNQNNIQNNNNNNNKKVLCLRSLRLSVEQTCQEPVAVLILSAPRCWLLAAALRCASFIPLPTPLIRLPQPPVSQKFGRRV